MTMLSLIASLALAQTNPVVKNDYMTWAFYPAASRIDDQEAPGGFGRGNNFPKPMNRKGEKLMAVLEKTGKGIRVSVFNGSNQSAWLQAADSNLMGFLEAKDRSGVWQPIQFHHWYTCGNSYHRVNVPSKHGWEYQVDIPSGSVKTHVRWRLDMGETKLVSNELPFSLPATRFRLSPEMAQSYKLKSWGQYTAIVPVGFGGR
jgi:hypothetical protein